MSRPPPRSPAPTKRLASVLLALVSNDVTMQLVNDANDHCWGDTYASPSTNVAGTFAAVNR